MKTLKESLLDPGFDIKPVNEISIALNSVDWEHYVLRVFRTKDINIFKDLQNLLEKHITSKLSTVQAVTAVKNPDALNMVTDGQSVMIFGTDKWSFRGDTREKWDFIQINSPLYNVRIRFYWASIDGQRVEISLTDPHDGGDPWQNKKSAMKKCFVISDGAAITKAFWNFYENTIRRKDIVSLPY